MENLFKVGDRVIVNKRNWHGIPFGFKGTIKEIGQYESLPLAIEFDTEFPGGHDCDGFSITGRGHWLHPDEVDLLIENKELTYCLF